MSSSNRLGPVRTAARRLVGRLVPGPNLGSLSATVIGRLDRLPLAVPVMVGLVPAALLGWIVLKSPAATGLLLLLLPVVLRRQGQRIRVLWEGEGPLRAAVSPVPAVPPPPTRPYRVQDRLIEMVELPGGCFWMGSDKASDPQAYGDESPSREVRISPFAMARTPVTRGLYRSLVKHPPREWGRDKDDAALPANFVSWDDARRFCNALSERSGLNPCYRESGGGWACDWAADGYRLPTEAEWEYACRAGTETPWFWGRKAWDARRYAWFSGNSGYAPHPVAENLANPWGLHDMAGNCWEWCWDWYASPYDCSATDDPRGPAAGKWRVLRGGSFGASRDLRSADRYRRGPEFESENLGFRCVRGSGRQPLP